jgi:Ca-activated chloride channel family protein
MGMGFASAWVLYLLWAPFALAALWLWLERRQRARLEAFVAAALQPRLVPAQGRAAGLWQIGLGAAGLLLLTVALARPRWGEAEETIYVSSREVMILLDVSRSMLARDVHPSRLQRAKTDLLDVLRELRGDRAGLIAFRNKPMLLCPLTTDYAFLRQALDGAEPDSAPRGETDIGAAIRFALDAFDNQSEAHRALLLVSDGEDLTGGARAAAEEARRRGVPVFTVGFGSRSGVRIPEPGKDGAFVTGSDGEVVTRLDAVTLDEIARMSGGAFVPVETAGVSGTTLGTIYRNYLRQVRERESEEALERRAVERFQWFLLPGCALLLAACGLSRGRLAARPGAVKRRTVGGAARKAAAFVLAAALAANAAAAPAATNEPPPAASAAAATNAPLPRGGSGELAREGQRLFRSGRGAEAARAYMAAAAASPSRSARYRYNAAAALFSAGDFAGAADLLRGLEAGTAAPDALVSQGLGAALFRQAGAVAPTNAAGATARAAQLRDAAAAFQSALRAGDSDAAGNLAAARRDFLRADEEAATAKLMEQYGSLGAFPLAERMLRAQRGIRRELEAVRTNEVPRQVLIMEALGRRQAENAALWVPLKSTLMQALQSQAGASTNAARRAAEAEQAVEIVRSGMRKTAGLLRDAEAGGTEGVAADEAAVYGFWKALAPCDPLLGEALGVQTQMWAQAAEPAPDAVVRQHEVRQLTDLFRERFPQEFPEEAAAAQPGAGDATNAPALTPEDRRKIEDLTRQAMAAQEAAEQELGAGGGARPRQEESARLLREIRDLLPRQQQQTRQQQEQDGEQQQSRENQSEQQQGERDNERQQQEQETQQQESETEAGEQEQQQAQGATNAVPEDVEKLLEQALERELQYELRKRERNRFWPMRPGERDW